MGAAPPAEVGLGEQREADAGEDAAPLERRDDDPAARAAQLRGGGHLVEHREREAVLGEELLDASGGTGAVRAHDDGVLVVQQLPELLEQGGGLADRGRPRERGDRRGLR